MTKEVYPLEKVIFKADRPISNYISFSLTLGTFFFDLTKTVDLEGLHNTTFDIQTWKLFENSDVVFFVQPLILLEPENDKD